MRGIWRCNGGCNRWNVYVAQVKKSWDKVDVVCSNCTKRKQFYPVRQDERGAFRNVNWMRRPNHMPRKALIDEIQARNRLQKYKDRGDGFTRGDEW